MKSYGVSFDPFTFSIWRRKFQFDWDRGSNMADATRGQFKVTWVKTKNKVDVTFS